MLLRAGKHQEALRRLTEAVERLESLRKDTAARARAQTVDLLASLFAERDANFARLVAHVEKPALESETTWLSLALVNHQLGRKDEARKWLGKAPASLDDLARRTAASALHWPLRLEAELLRAEAERLIR